MHKPRPFLKKKETSYLDSYMACYGDTPSQKHVEEVEFPDKKTFGHRLHSPKHRYIRTKYTFLVDCTNIS